MLSSLYSRLALSLFFIFLAVAAALLFLFEFSSRGIQNETTQQLHRELAEHIVHDLVIAENGAFDKKSIKSAFHMMMVLGPAIELYIIDPEGGIVTYDAPEEKILRARVGLEPVHKFIAAEKELPIFGDDPRSLQRQKIFSAAPIYHNNELRGYLYIILGGELQDNIANALQLSHVGQVSGLGLGAALLLMFSILLLLFYAFTRPLQRLAETMDRFARDQFKQLPTAGEGFGKRHKLIKGKEVLMLEKSFTEMGQLIQQQLKSLERQDELRRQFLSHVAHDLRTPLTATQANLESLLLKMDGLSDRDKKAMVQKSLTSCMRLGKLIQELFELARLEDHQVTLHKEVFPLMDLISDLLQSFSLPLEEKSIQLHVKVEDPAIEVNADVGKLERVLQNLMENAIRFTPEHGEITLLVGMNEDNETIELALEDTGPGIDGKDLPFLFEPYFTVKDSVKNFKQGTGLGLAISKHLVQLHESDLMIETRVGEGCRFSFQLKAAT